ncbi:MAG: hypothetical protein ABSB88_13515 [Bryobacteraceae bacterium]|jgi:hypothetical protein
MSRFFFYPVLDALNDGKVIRNSLSVALKVMGVLSLLAGAYLLIEILKMVFQLPTDGTIGGLLFAVIFVATVLAIAQIFWYRAGSVAALGDSPFTVIPIVSILLRLAGEVYATLGVSVGVGSCLFIWFATNNPLGLVPGLGGFLPSTSPGTGFLGGLSFLIYLSVASLMALVFFYFLAEASYVMIDVARHVRLLVKQGAPSGKAPVVPETSSVL